MDKSIEIHFQELRDLTRYSVSFPETGAVFTHLIDICAILYHRVNALEIEIDKLEEAKQ
jgi:hypothetical protein